MYMYMYRYIDIMYFPFLATFGIIPPDHNSTFFFWVVHLRNAWNKTMQHTYHTYIPSSYQKLPSKAADIRASSAASKWWAKIHGLHLPAAWDSVSELPQNVYPLDPILSYPILS